VIIVLAPTARSQTQEASLSDRVFTWLQFQAIPSITILSSTSATQTGFEWEATPLLYSFGMTRLVSPWKSFIVEPPARFTGSIEFVVSGQILTEKVGNSYFGGSAQLLGHIPLIERGEHLGLTVGIGSYSFSQSTPFFKVVGISTLFGFLHFNLKQSASPKLWVGSIEFRFF